jgi:hypothetical protein
MVEPKLTCTGRAVDDNLRPVGPPCGRTIGNDDDWFPIEDVARAAGWSIAGPHVMCPACRRPDPAIAAGLANRNGGVGRG